MSIRLHYEKRGSEFYSGLPDASLAQAHDTQRRLRGMLRNGMVTKGAARRNLALRLLWSGREIRRRGLTLRRRQ